MEEEHYIEFSIELSLSDTIYERKGTSSDAIDQIKVYEKQRIIELIKEVLRNTTYEVEVK